MNLIQVAVTSSVTSRVALSSSRLILPRVWPMVDSSTTRSLRCLFHQWRIKLWLKSRQTSSGRRRRPFTYKMKPLLKADDLGFDSISIDTPVQPISVDALRIGGVEATFELISSKASGFTIRIPRVDTDQTGN